MNDDTFYQSEEWLDFQRAVNAAHKMDIPALFAVSDEGLELLLNAYNPKASLLNPHYS